MSKRRNYRFAGVACAEIIVALIAAALVVEHLPSRFYALRPIVHSSDYIPSSRLTPFQLAVLRDAEQQTRERIEYRNGYYIGGDPPQKIGVCTDVVIRCNRAGGLDLKTLVNADIRQHPALYHISKPDPNIDYRRTRNLAVFLRRFGRSLPISGAGADWQPGDIVIFDTLGNGNPDHAAIISDGIDQNRNPTIIQHWPGHYVTQTAFIGFIPILYHYRLRPRVT